MTQRRTLLLDYHGVISDGKRLPADWRRLVGEFLTPRFGSTRQVWADANRHALSTSLARMRARTRDGSRAQYEEFRRLDRIEWLRDMLLYADVAVPDDDELDAVALEVIRYVPPRTRASVPGAADTLRTLHGRGFVLYTASGDDSENLRGYLRGLGVDALFTETYGADLLGVGKDGPGFYRALLAHTGADPAAATVVDDDGWRLDWARALGMSTVLVGEKDPRAEHPRVARFADLAEALA